MDKRLIAPCGMNCSICLTYLRDKNACLGCLEDSINKPEHCINCLIRNCKFLEETKSKFCYDCSIFPCARLKQLDRQYLKNYNISMIENLETIKEVGLNEFVRMEENNWTCTICGGPICIHKGLCISCEEKVICRNIVS